MRLSVLAARPRTLPLAGVLHECEERFEAMETPAGQRFRAE